MSDNNRLRQLISNGIITFLWCGLIYAEDKQHTRTMIKTTESGRIFDIVIANEGADSPIVGMTVSLHKSDSQGNSTTSSLEFRTLELSLDVDQLVSLSVADWQPDLQQRGVVVLWSGRKADEYLYGWATGDGNRHAEGSVPRTARMKRDSFIVRMVSNCGSAPCGDTISGILESSEHELVHFVHNCASLGTKDQSIGELRHLLPGDALQTID